MCAYTKQDDKIELKDHIPTVLDTYSALLQVGDRDIALEVFDTAGQEDFAHIRKAVYPGTDIFIMCYSCVNRGSLDNIESFWYTETKKVLPKVAVVLAGNKVDLKESQPKLYVKHELADETRMKIGARAHVQCSARDEALGISKEGQVEKIFKYAIKFGLQLKRKPEDPTKCACSLL